MNLGFGGGEEVRIKEEESYWVESDGETMIDRLSALPDSLILRILSFLGPGVKETAVTSVLSKRWQYLWSESPRLFFWTESPEPEKIRDFVSWIHRTLLLRSRTCLERFQVHLVYDECYATDVNAWVRFAVKSKVKDLTLVIRSRTCFYTLPQVLYSNSSLTSLSVERCNLAPQRTIKWQSLTRLFVEDVELHDHVIQKILSGCPVLSLLMLESCWGFNRLDVKSESLYELHLSVAEDKNSAPLIEISAPYLRSLFISFCPYERNLQLTNIPSLICADIHFDGYDDSMEVMNNAMELLEKTKHAKDLMLGSAFIEVLSELVMHGRQLPQSRRDFLMLNTWRNEDSIPGILCLLESSPNLETLVIECLEPYEESVRTWGPAVRDDLDCNLLYLKTIRLFDYADPNLTGEPMLTMAQILLKRATKLEEMVIRGDLSEFSSEFAKMSETVISYPRSSEKAVIILHQ